MKGKWHAVNVKIFVIFELLVYALFLYLDITSSDAVLSGYVKFSGIVMCFVYVLLESLLHRDNNKDRSAVLTALLFTVCADICLLLADYYEWGVAFFILVQVWYLYRLWGAGAAASIKGILVFRCILFLAAMAALLCMKIPVDRLLLITVFYFINIVHNTLLAVKWFRSTGDALDEDHNRKALFFVSGMILFVLCDINVGIYNCGGYLSGQGAVYEAVMSFASVGMWLFYLPSQVLISLSGGIGH